MSRFFQVISGLPKAVLTLGLVSFFTDVSSEMIYPLLPVFLFNLLGASPMAIGLIEGVAETALSFLKLFSGIWTDQWKIRKPFLVMGYGFSGFVRPLIGIVGTWPMVLILRLLDRTGKGVRTSPRDAMIADVTRPTQRGAAFGFHRSMDHAGAVIGPLIAAVFLHLWGMPLRYVFLLAAVPAAISFLVLVVAVKEPKNHESFYVEPQIRGFQFLYRWKQLNHHFKLLLLALLIFTLGNSTDAFLLLRLSNVGIPTEWIAILWSCHHIVKMLSSYWAGIASDQMGRKKMIILGWAVYAIIYLLFAVVHTPLYLVIVFLAYGLYFGLTEPAEKALVSDLVPPHLLGSAFGFYHSVVGIGALPASLLFGLLWQQWGMAAAFLMGSGLAMIASILLLVSSDLDIV